MGNIHIADKLGYHQKLNALEQSGKVRVIADFDHTITQTRKISASCFGLLNSIPGLDPQFGRDRDVLFRKYHPHEFNPNKSERDKLMEEWTQRSMNLHHRYNLKASDFNNVDPEKSPFRQGWKEFLHFCHVNNVPTYILSAGITQIIRTVLEGNQIDTSQIQIISNNLIFDSDGNYNGSYPTEVIHTGNKAVHTTSHDDYVLLFGDSIDDTHMAGETDRDMVLSVGFHNPETQFPIEVYGEHFDVVIESGDSDEGFLYELAKRIAK